MSLQTSTSDSMKRVVARLDPIKTSSPSNEGPEIVSRRQGFSIVTKLSGLVMQKSDSIMHALAFTSIVPT